MVWSVKATEIPCLVWLQKLGLLALVNEESRFPKGTDSTLLEKLHSQHGVSKCMRAYAVLHIFYIYGALLKWITVKKYI